MVEMTPELAEICGIHAGDGYMRNDGHRIELDISGNLEEFEYYDDHVGPLFQKTFNLSVKNRFFLSRRTYGFVLRSLPVVELLHSLGFPYGAKTLTVRVPRNIMASRDPAIWCLFLRGLLDTDGCISFRRFYGPHYSEFKRTFHNYPNITITVVSRALIEDVAILLQRLGFTFNIHTYSPSMWNKVDSHKITVNGVSGLHHWISLIGSKNPIKLSRYLVWKKLGYCPTNTTYQQRKDLLKDEMPSFSKGP